jgi:hypothetical protein
VEGETHHGAARAFLEQLALDLRSAFSYLEVEIWEVLDPVEELLSAWMEERQG